MSLTQYLESQKNQNMTRLLNFLKLKKGEEMWFFVYFEMEEREVYIEVVEEI